MTPGSTAAGSAQCTPSVISDSDFEAISATIHRSTGILIGQSKRSMLVSRLSRRLRHLHLDGFGEYRHLINSAAGGPERQALISAITTNVTSFFRESAHFEALEVFMAPLVERARNGGRVRLWSAGCSTGEEPYSIAATLLNRWPDIASLDLRILATDIDPLVIAHARRGVYDACALGDKPPLALRPHLQSGPQAGEFSFGPALRNLIRFEELNLLEAWPFTGRFDVIFCRNVVIYFDAGTRLDIWRRFAERIHQDGRLFIGHSERMDQRLEGLFTPSGVTQYRRTAILVKPDPVERTATEDTNAPPQRRRTTCP